MLRAWVALGFLFSVSAFGQAEILIKAENGLSVNQIACGEIGADLDISLNQPGAPVGAYIILKNYRTVMNNTASRVLKFNVNDSSVGIVNLKKESGAYEVLRAAAKDSGCEVEVTREAGMKVSVALSCRDLAPKSSMLTLPEKSRQLLATAQLSEKISCTIQPEKR